MKTRHLHVALLVLYMMQAVGLTIAIGLSATDFDIRIYWSNETFMVFDDGWNPVYLLIPYLFVPVIFHVGFLMAQRFEYVNLGDLDTPEVGWTHLVRWMEIGVTHAFALTFVAQVSGNSDMWVLVHIVSHTLGLHVVGYLSEVEQRPQIYLCAVVPAVAIIANICISVFYDKTEQELWVMAFAIFFQYMISTTLHALQLFGRITYRTLEQGILMLNIVIRTIVVWEGFNFVHSN